MKNNANLEIQANELDRFDLGSIKIILVNYFKYCLSRSSLYYELNENLMFEGRDEFDIKTQHRRPFDSSIRQPLKFKDKKLDFYQYLQKYRSFGPFLQLSDIVRGTGKSDICQEAGCKSQ